MLTFCMLRKVYLDSIYIVVIEVNIYMILCQIVATDRQKKKKNCAHGIEMPTSASNQNSSFN
jgi:hypothetical protein